MGGIGARVGMEVVVWSIKVPFSGVHCVPRGG
jgi:hypothetical protein